MEQLTPADGDSPVRSPTNEATNADDPLRPEVEEENSTPVPPIGAPEQDMEATEDAADGSDADLAPDAEDSDKDDESDLSEIDEAQFENFDPEALAIEERPVAIDETNVGLLGTHKRKRVEGEGERKKRKEGRREKTKKIRRVREDSDGGFSGGEVMEGKRRRRAKDITEGDEAPARPREKKRAKTPEDLDSLTPEERRKRELDRKMDDMLKNPNRARKRMAGIDLEAQQDDLIDNMRHRMAAAAQADLAARREGRPATAKLQMLPEVVSLLNRNTLREQLMDPETNILEAVRFFLEPLDDGSLPAYNIQRELFAALGKLPVNKDALVASSIGKVVLFYTKSARPEPVIKRQAERLLGEWARPIIKRSDDYRKRAVQHAAYDPNALPVRPAASSQAQGPAAAAAAARERKLATPSMYHRARPQEKVGTYSIAPRSNVTIGQQNFAHGGGTGEDSFKRLKARQLGAQQRGARR